MNINILVQLTKVKIQPHLEVVFITLAHFFWNILCHNFFGQKSSIVLKQVKCFKVRMTALGLIFVVVSDIDLCTELIF